jgi:hypothetical protein
MEYNLYILVGKGESESYRLTPGKIYMVGRHSTNNIIIIKYIQITYKQNHIR